MFFEKLVETLVSIRDLSRPPIFQVMFALQNNEQADLQPIAEAGLTLELESLAGVTAKFDLTLSLGAREDGLGGVVEYNRDFFDVTIIERRVGYFMILGDYLYEWVE